MPIGFWNDPGGAKYHAAYFERFPGVWCHGDYVELTAHDGLIIYGRSDATLNPGGVRIGTAEIYRQVEQLDEVIESIVIGQDWPPGDIGDVRVVLFVRLRDGLTLDRGAHRPDQAAHPRQHDSAPRTGQDRAGQRHSAHQERQDRRARRAQRRARRAGEEPRGAGQSGGAGTVPGPPGTENLNTRADELLAVIAALALEQWRAFRWRNGAQHAFVRYAGLLERRLNGGKARQGAVAAALALGPPVAIAAAAYCVLDALHPLLGFVLNVAVLYLLVGFRHFSHAFTAVADALKAGDALGARRRLAAWRGVDASGATAEEIPKLAIERGLEDSYRHVFGTLFWFLVLPGPGGAVLYRLAVLLVRALARRSVHADGP